MQQGRLARARTAKERDRLALANVEVDVRESRHLGFAAPVHDGDPTAAGEPRHTATLPSRISTTRSADAATAGGGVTTTTVAADSRRGGRSPSITTSSLRPSRPALASTPRH